MNLLEEGYTRRTIVPSRRIPLSLRKLMLDGAMALDLTQWEAEHCALEHY